MDTARVKGFEFELAYLCQLTPEGVKPLSRWEKTLDHATEQRLHALGLENRQVCGAVTNMGFVRIVNPLEDQSIAVPNIAKHFLEHGSFNYCGTEHSGRLNAPLLNHVLTSAGLGHFLHESAASDSDDDGLRNSEQAAFWCQPVLCDTDGDGLKGHEEPPFRFNKDLADLDGAGLPDGFALAGGMWKDIIALPTSPNSGIYLTSHEAPCFVPCPVCGKIFNCGHVVITNRPTGLSLQISHLSLHFLERGSFAVSAHERVDPLQVEAVLRPGVVIRADESQVALRWMTRAEHQYQLLTASQLLGPWTPGSTILGDGTEQEFTEAQPTGANCRFHKIVVTRDSGK